MHFSRRLFFHTASLKHDISIAYRTKALYSPSPLLLLPWSTWKLKTRREMAQNFLASAVPSSNWQGCSSLSQKRVQDKYEPENWSCKNQMLASETTWQLSRCRSTAWFSSALATLSVRYCYSAVYQILLLQHFTLTRTEDRSSRKTNRKQNKIISGQRYRKCSWCLPQRNIICVEACVYCSAYFWYVRCETAYVSY